MTPLAKSTGFLKTLTVTPWYYKGSSASAQPATFTDALKKDRYGIFAGLKERRLTAGLEFAQRTEGVETITGPTQTVTDRTGRLLDGFAVVDWIRERPLLARTPLLVYSAREVTAAEQKKLILGPTEFVTKSRVSLQEFEARIAHLLFGTENEALLNTACAN